MTQTYVERRVKRTEAARTYGCRKWQEEEEEKGKESAEDCEEQHKRQTKKKRREQTESLLSQLRKV